MSRERFNELIEGYARGELPASQAQEFRVLIEGNAALAREARETAEIVRLARLAERPMAPPGLLHGALARARSAAADKTPAPDMTASANVILVPGSDGSMRRIAIHTENAATSVAQADPQLWHSWRHYNWGFAAAAIAILVLGTMVAVEIGPAMMGKRAPVMPREEDVTYLATATIYQSEVPANEFRRPSVREGGSYEPVGFSATIMRQRLEQFSGSVADGAAMAATTPTEDPGVLGVESRYQGRPMGELEIAALPDLSTASKLDADRDSGPVLEPGDMPQTLFARPAAGSLREGAANEQMIAMRAPSAETASDEMKTMQMADPAQPGAVEPEADSRGAFGAMDTGAMMLADAAPPQRVLSDLEVEFLLAQARVAGGGEAPRSRVGFAPLVTGEAPTGPREELAMVFPDRGSYDSFLSRVRMTPLVSMSDPASLNFGTPDVAAYDRRTGTTSRGDLYRGPPPPGNMPSPVTGLAAAPTAPRSTPTPRASALPSHSMSGSLGAPEMAESAAGEEPEIGKPLDLSRYDLHLTTDVQTGQVRVTLRPLQPGERSTGIGATRTPSPPPGARR